MGVYEINPESSGLVGGTLVGDMGYMNWLQLIQHFFLSQSQLEYRLVLGLRPVSCCLVWDMRSAKKSVVKFFSNELIILALDCKQ